MPQRSTGRPVRHRAVASQGPRHRSPTSPVPQQLRDGRAAVRHAASGLLTASVVATAGLELLTVAPVPGVAAIALAADVTPSRPTPAWGTGQQSVGNINLYGPNDPAPTRSAPGHLKVVVLGDSYTSGEGANSASYRTVTVTGTDPGYGNSPPVSTVQVDPAHQSSTAPALQAVRQLAAQHPDVVFDVVFAPVSGADTQSIQQRTRPGTPFEQPAQLDAASGADIVLLGIGGNDAKFRDAVMAGLNPFSSNATATKALDGYLADAASPEFRDRLTDVYRKIADKAAPGADIITYGYPQTLPTDHPQPTVPDTDTWLNTPEAVPQPTYPLTAAPFTMGLLNELTLPRFNQLGVTVNSQIKSATEAMATGQSRGQTWTFVDNAQALAGHYLGSFPEGMNGFKPSGMIWDSVRQEMYHPNDLGQSDLAKPLQDPLANAAQRQLTPQQAPPEAGPSPAPADDQVIPADEVTPADQVTPADEATPADQVTPADEGMPVENASDWTSSTDAVSGYDPGDAPYSPTSSAG